MRKTFLTVTAAAVLSVAGCGSSSSNISSMGSSVISSISSAMGQNQNPTASPLPASPPTPPPANSPDSASLASNLISSMPGQTGGKLGQITNLVSTGVNTGKDLTASLTLDEHSEPDLGESVGVSLTNSYPSPQIDPWTKYVAFVGMTVASTSPDQNIRYVFGVLNTNEVNACSGPGGYIFVTRGALKNMKDEAELAGVLAHEMAHILNHDGLSKARGAAQQKLLGDGMSFNKATAKFSKLADVGVTAILANPYSQGQETDADKKAVHLMSAAGYTPTSYLNFIQRLATLQANGGGAFSTHPNAADRATAISQEISTVGSKGVTLQARFVVNIPPQ